jgi:hypothetical protein
VILKKRLLEERDAMSVPNRLSAVLLFITVGAMTTAASAITAEVAKKCEALTAKAFPPREIGNPAAGSAKGAAQTQRDYFSKCVANGGEEDPDVSKKSK